MPTHGEQLTSKSRNSHDLIKTPRWDRCLRSQRAALDGPAARLGREAKSGYRRQWPLVIGGYRVHHERDVATPTVAAGIHRPQHAVQHGDQPRQVFWRQVGPDDTGSLATLGEVRERLIQGG